MKLAISFLTLWTVSLIHLQVYQVQCYSEDYDYDEEYDYDDYDDEEEDAEDEIEIEEEMEIMCKDLDINCEIWANSRMCFLNYAFMHETCPQTCNMCPPPPSTEDRVIEPWEFGLGDDMGVPQRLYFDQGASKHEIMWEISQARLYLQEEGLYGETPCQNLHSHCAYWGYMGECDSNFPYMSQQCGPVCGTCGTTMEESENDDCFENLVDIWQPGDLNKVFEKITSEPFTTQFNVNVLSSPEHDDGPWVIVIDDFISKEEAQRLIAHGTDTGFTRSVTTNAVMEDGTLGKGETHARTSSTAWCQHECATDDMVMGVMERIVNVTGIPEINYEDLQLLQYNVGQKYDVHHDMIPAHVHFPMGPRLLTGYIYLNEVREGGGTHFDKLDLTVMPKTGRLLLWPSVLDSDLHMADPRTSHAALPVERGTKYGANAWMHLRDFKTPYFNGCHEKQRIQ